MICFPRNKAGGSSLPPRIRALQRSGSQESDSDEARPLQFSATHANVIQSRDGKRTHDISLPEYPVNMRHEYPWAVTR